MRIVIDLQGAQNESRYRGIGRYSLALARAVAEQAGKHEVWLALNGRFPQGVLDLRCNFVDLIPPERIRVFEVPGPVAELVPANIWRTRAAEVIREHFLATLQPDIVHISSLFDGLGDDVVGSVGQSDFDLPTVITLYDLIPFLNPEAYLGGEVARGWYARKIESARQAELLLAISRYSAEEGRRLLELPEDKVVDIGTGIDSHFRPPGPDLRRDDRLRRLYGLDRPFILYTGAADPRKNLQGLLEAAALLPSDLREGYALALVGRFLPDQQATLVAHAISLGISDRSVRFLGYVPDEDLIALYGLCSLFVFPSLHEGFGLPAAEAMACGAVVIGSNTTNVPDVIGHADALFDPTRPVDMAACMQRVLRSNALQEELRRHGLTRSATFTWQAVARRTINAYELAHDRVCARRRTLVAAPAAGRHRLALVQSGPVPGPVLETLSERHDVTVVKLNEPGGGESVGRHDWAWFMAHGGEFDNVLYCPDSSRSSSAFLLPMETWPGVLLSRADTGADNTLRPLAVGLLVEAPGPDAATAPAPAANSYPPIRSVPPARQDNAADAWAAALASLADRTRPFATGLLDRVLALPPAPLPGDLALVADAIGASLPRPGAPQFLVDVSRIAEIDAGSGIQRVVRSILLALASDPPDGWRVEPVRAESSGYVYARTFSARLLGRSHELPASDDPVEVYSGDIFLGLDLAADQMPARLPWFETQRARGMRTVFVVYDLLPVIWPERFPDFLQPVFQSWIDAVAENSDGVLCISRNTAEEFARWFGDRPARRRDAPRLGWFHLGADVQSSLPTRGLIEQSALLIDRLRRRPFLLSVGTLEPRKGYAQALDAFERLWTRGVDVGFIIVGRPGWSAEALQVRLEQHPELNRRLIWLQEASDETLVRMYEAVTGLLAASEGEGFGLPLIEAAQHGLPILARDLPVFREVAGEHASYFVASDANGLSNAIHDWLISNVEGSHTPSDRMPWLTWRESARQLREVVVGGGWQMTIA